MAIFSGPRHARTLYGAFGPFACYEGPSRCSREIKWGALTYTLLHEYCHCAQTFSAFSKTLLMTDTSNLLVYPERLYCSLARVGSLER